MTEHGNRTTHRGESLFPVVHRKKARGSAESDVLAEKYGHAAGGFNATVDAFAIPGEYEASVIVRRVCRSRVVWPEQVFGYERARQFSAAIRGDVVPLSSGRPASNAPMRSACPARWSRLWLASQKTTSRRGNGRSWRGTFARSSRRQHEWAWNHAPRRQRLAAPGARPIAALYVTRGGVYYGLDGVDPWDEERDARLYDGPHPVVAHPPCAAWCRLAGFRESRYGLKRGDDGGCFEAALRAVRSFGGVLEHPAYSDAWKAFGLPRPITRDGWTLAFDGGASCYVEQGRYGLPVKKATWLYAFGVDPPALRWGFIADASGDPANQCEYVGMDAWRDRFKGRVESWIAGAPNRSVVDRDGDRRNRPSHLGLTSTTPPAFRDALIGIARSAYIRSEAVA